MSSSRRNGARASTKYLLFVDEDTGAIHRVPNEWPAERVAREWSPELERELVAVYGRGWTRPRASRAPGVPRATGKPSRDLATLRRHLAALASSSPRPEDRALAAGLVEDIDAAAAMFSQDPLPAAAEAA